MAVSTRSFSRQRDYSRLFIALAVLAAVMAVTPIAAAVLGYGTTAVTPKTAFATAPRGDYAVFGRSDGQGDVISVAWAGSPGAVTEIARVPHLPGFASTGAVSPDGKQIALVSVDGGSPSHPVASLNVVDLETGLVRSVARNIVPGQVPVWSRDSSSIVVSRMPAGNEARGPIHLVEVSTGGEHLETLLAAVDGVLGIFPVGYTSNARIVSIVVDARGSVLRIGDFEWGLISDGITRDWKLSPDGAELAFIETVTSGGVQYRARAIRLADGPGVSAQALSAEVSALGTAWNPATKAATFGVEPAAAKEYGSVGAQSLSSATSSDSGFDVPLGYSADGENLAVTRWSGQSFQAPGQPVLQIVSAAGRTNYESFTRFYGWSAR